ncbi:MAG: polyprenyl synthetase family protein [Xanthomonadales bacterium]|nr:polyprenyl synthetase family protein [Xanthomonadales bacterium]
MPNAPDRLSPATGASSLADVTALTAAGMARVDAAIRRELYSDVLLIRQIGEHIIAAGGKRLRPQLVLLCAQACGSLQEDAVQLAVVVEFIHTATLLHDDVVDGSDLRRGRATANALWGNAPSVLVGDFLYSRAFQLMVGVNRMAVMRILADTTNRIAEGEVLQLMQLGDPETSEARYRDVIERKTAVLFAAACRLGALSAGADSDTELAAAAFGHHLGMAFQIADDLLDYTGDAERIGKHLGDDLAEGKLTLPLILALQRGSDEVVQCIADALREGRREALPAVVQALRSTDALEACEARAETELQAALQALDGLPQGPCRDGLAFLADYALHRQR